MNGEHNIISRVLMAQNNIDKADSLIRDYFPFIKSETAKTIGRIPVEGKDEELSIALMGFHEAIESYNQGKGTFLSFAALVINRRIIDFLRQEEHNSFGVSWEEMTKSEETFGSKHTHNADVVSDVMALKWEIAALTDDLKRLEITISEVAANCPKYEKAVISCKHVIKYLINQPDKMESVFETGKLPIRYIIKETPVKKKTLEQHRKYLVALIIIYYKKYECLIEHMAEVFKLEKGGK